MKPQSFFEPDFFRNNRSRLRELFTGTAPIIISGNYLLQKSSDTSYDFVQDSNFWYLTGLDEPGLTLVMDGDKEYIIAPNHDPVRAVFEGELEQSLIAKISGIETVYESDEGWKILGKKLVKSKHAATIQPSPAYIESMTMFTSPAKLRAIEKIKENNPDIDLIDLRKILATMRSIKQPEEIEMIKQAVAHTAKLYKIIEKTRVKSVNENQIMAELTKYMVLNDLEFAYAPIIASGKNALTLHYTNNNSEIDQKNFLLLDVAAKYSSYCADVTRTVVSAPSKRQQNIYEAVLSVQEYAISLLKPGVLLEDYEQKVHEFMGEKLRELGLLKTISKETVGQFYPHSTSHFLGIDPHDAGDYKSALQPGMVLTVEPGIYVNEENIGVRIEDMALITESGCEVISSAIKKDISKLAD